MIESQNNSKYPELYAYAKKESDSFILELCENKDINYIKLTDALGKGILQSINETHKSKLSQLIGEQLVSLFVMYTNSCITDINSEDLGFNLIHTRNILDTIKKYFPYVDVSSLEEVYTQVQSGEKNITMIRKDAHNKIFSDVF